MPIQHNKAFRIYHWDTFDNETILIAETDTFDDAKEIVKKKYGDRINHEVGADQIDIVNRAGSIVKKYRIT